MESIEQRILGIKAILNNIKLKEPSSNSTYEFTFAETMGRVVIVLADGKEAFYKADVVYTDTFQIKIADSFYTITTLINGGKIELSLNAGQIKLFA